MVTFSTWLALTRSMNVLNGIFSVAPLVVWKRLQSRKTRTMMTTQRRAVLTVEFNECLQGARDAASVPNDVQTDGTLWKFYSLAAHRWLLAERRVERPMANAQQSTPY